ncbi:uncharacterized protein LOC110604081 isoform X3 [Manihot esculenta]|uniref:Uncharacterized protein n=1 Tax=Manihot esculenta TaxID=3983 RepID=A0ACB7G5H1_MANES|nr:uncharacterized protein LOC110604081 isoform X3 [Manihot esculenta]KAG8635467.1 hypothetical protein MANES_16G041300v8 [Manihot esculenta]
MASRKKQSEGIALLSMYNDEDDEDMEDLDDQQREEQQQKQEDELLEPQNDYRESNEQGPDSLNDTMVIDEFPNDSSSSVLSLNSTPKDGLLRPLTPQQPQVSFSSSLQQQQQRLVNLEVKRSGRGRLTIVDYGHDEVAMSPEPEEGEFVEELLTANAGASQEITPAGTVQVLTPSAQATPQSSELLETSQPDEMNNAVILSEAAENEGTTNVPAEDAGSLDKFLPPPPKEKCPEELQRKIDKFLALKKVGRSFNAEVRNRKDYRNPDFLLHAVRYQDIDQIGSCFSKDVFDPHGYDKSDFFDEIAGASSALHSTSTTADAVARDGRQNKKTKWDKVDGDGRNLLPTGGQDSLATVAAHAALLSAANVGAGYTAFVQQKRREAEEKRSSEKKLERRS